MFSEALKRDAAAEKKRKMLDSIPEHGTVASNISASGSPSQLTRKNTFAANASFASNN